MRTRILAAPAAPKETPKVETPKTETAIEQTAPAQAEVSGIPDDIENLMKECHKAHTEKKKADAAYEKARKSLYKAMLKGELKKVVSGTHKLEAVVEHSKVTVINKETLESLVGHKAAQAVYTATKTAVIDKFGTEIAEQCAETVEGTENVTVKPL